MEIWKDIPNYEGLYQASNLGKIRSIYRYKKILKPNITNSGYETVELYNGQARKRLLVHRLVASTFIQNPESKPQINHIDENKNNNCIENLEWCTAKENMNHGTRTERQRNNTDYTTEKRKSIARINGRTASKPVEQYTKEGAFIKKYCSAKEAALETNSSHSHILECCHGNRYKTVNGFVWKFERGSDLLVSQF